MKTIVVKKIELHFDEGFLGGDPERQAKDAIHAINLTLQREPYGLGAQLLYQGGDVTVENWGDEDED